MIFGATIAGMTSEGGGAVAFPVMTLALGIKPSVARDFSLMIQSCGKYCFLDAIAALTGPSSRGEITKNNKCRSIIKDEDFMITCADIST